MNLDKIPKPGTTITRKRFWDKARDIVLSLQKKEGRNVSVDERQGAGTVINVIRERGIAEGVCPPEEVSEITLALTDLSFGCGCQDNAPDGDPIPSPPYAEWLWSDDYGINDNYVLARDGGDPTHWFLTGGAMAQVKTWTSGHRTCPDDPDLDTPVNVNFDAYCVDGIWTVIISFGSFPGPISAPAFALFYGTSASPVPNAVPSCGYPPSFNTDHGYFKGVSMTGNATISW